MTPLPYPALAALAAALVLAPHRLPAEPAPGDGRRITLPYADPAGGRTLYRYADQPVNAFRLYDFYARQADYYMDEANPVPELLPAFPGLDAGAFGHWGKFSQNDHTDRRWNAMDVGSVVGGVLRSFDLTVPRGISVKLGEYGEVSAVFDPDSLTYRAVWEPGFVIFSDRRFGMMDGIVADGDPLLINTGKLPVDAYHGYYRHGKQVVFGYRTGGVEVLDHPGAIYSRIGDVFTRTLAFPEGADSVVLPLFDVPMELDETSDDPVGGLPALSVMNNADARVVAVRAGDDIGAFELGFGVGDRTQITIGKVAPGGQLTLYLFGGNRASLAFFEAKVEGDTAPTDISTLTAGGGGLRWEGSLGVDAELGEATDAYAVDTIPVPADNPFGSLMFLAGHDFFSDGRIAVSTIMGDVWIVDGIDTIPKDLAGLSRAELAKAGASAEIRWHRFAAGLHQPLGLCIVDDKVVVLGKDQMTRLHDLDGDGEADYYENFCNQFETSAGGHDYATGLQRDGDGNFYFATGHAGVYKVAPDGSAAEVIATGIRNPNGVGVSRDGIVTVGGQEGDSIPASSVIQVKEGGFYGFRADAGQDIDLPLAFVPRGIDNSTAGQAFVETGNRWGPVENQIVSLSFGAGTYYLVLREVIDGVPQGAVVPMDGDFISAPNRARFSPHDGQLYVSCSEGWGDYAAADGALHRVRFTGKPFLKPVGFHATAGGLRVDFAEALDPATAEDPRNFFAQQWQYRFSAGYGSPEMSIRQPGTVGHDPLAIGATRLVDGGKSVFIEIPDLAPVMQLHLRMHLKTAGGEPFRAELFPTIHKLEGVEERLTATMEATEVAANPDQEPDVRPGRAITIKALGGLHYDTTEFTVTAGERISLTLDNTDIIPHNLVISRPDTKEKVGDLSNRMLGDADAVERHYVPDSDAVLHFLPVLQLGDTATIHFDAPQFPGDYPFLCTFPGHWMLMNGMMVVADEE
ncbi:hypothetical protein BH23VER1_BH23VER1_26060 [soil metagenome]